MPVHLSIETRLIYTTPQPCDVLLQIEAATDPSQTCHSEQFDLGTGSHSKIIAGEDQIGHRRWIRTGPIFTCHYKTQVTIHRETCDIAQRAQTPRPDLPASVVPYLMPSRYCHSELFVNFVHAQFGHLTGGALASGIAAWINANFTYDPNASFAGTTATDSFASLAGVCRDYAHVLIALLRAAGLPARFVSAYAPDVTPPDFHALTEVYLAGAWHLIDATGMSTPQDVVRIGVGRDAADASFMTSYGWMELQEQSVTVTRLDI